MTVNNYDTICSRNCTHPHASNTPDWLSGKNVITGVTLCALGALTAYECLYDLPAVGAKLLGGVDAVALVGLVTMHTLPSSQPNRFDEALRAAQAGDRTLLSHLDAYNLSDEQETLVVKALFQKNPSAYRCLEQTQGASRSLCTKVVEHALEREQFHLVSHLHRYNLNPEKRFTYVQELARLFPDSIAAHLHTYHLTADQERQIAFQIARAPNGNIARDLPCFSGLSSQDRRELAQIALEKDPTQAFEHWENFGFPSSEPLPEVFQPYQEMAQTLEALERGEPVFETALLYAQHITAISTLPESFSDRLIHALDARLADASIEDILVLAQTVNQYPSASTFRLIGRIVARAQKIVPDLNTYMTNKRVFMPSGDSFYTAHQTKLTGRGFDLLSAQIQSPIPVAPTTYVQNLAGVVERFSENGEAKRLAVPVSFCSDLTQHFCLLYLEKDGQGNVRAFISDSTGEHNEKKYPKRVREELASLPLKDVYVLEPQRQFGFNVCSIFLLEDIAEIGKHADFFAVLERDGSVETVGSDGPPYKRVHAIPAGMMRMMQSMGKVKRFIAENGDALQSGALLSAHVASVSHYERDKFGNRKLQNKEADWKMGRNVELLLRTLQSSEA